LEIVANYLKGSAKNWFEDICEEITVWKKPEDDENEREEEGKSFEELFFNKFASRERKRNWRKQLANLKQGEMSISSYINKFNN